MTATFIGAGNDPTSGESSVSSRVVTKPAGATIAVFFVCAWIGGAGNPTITPPGGAVSRNNVVLGETRTATYLKYVNADNTGTTYTFSFSVGTWCDLKALFFADVDLGLDLATVPFNTANSASATTAYPSTTVTTVSGAALAWSGNDAEYGGTPAQSPPTDFTETGDTYGSGAAYRISPGDGSQSATGGATSVSTSNVISSLVALAPAAGAVPYVVQAAGPWPGF